MAEEEGEGKAFNTGSACLKSEAQKHAEELFSLVVDTGKVALMNHVISIMDRLDVPPDQKCNLAENLTWKILADTLKDLKSYYSNQQ